MRAREAANERIREAIMRERERERGGGSEARGGDEEVNP